MNTHTERERERGREGARAQRFLPTAKQAGLQMRIVTVRINLKMLEPWPEVGGHGDLSLLEVHVV